MIVNTAYIYMGSGGGGGEPVNPNLWQDGVSNYPVEFTGSCSISSAGLNFITSPGSATFSELTLTGFNSLTLSGSANTVFSSISITVEFFNSTGKLLGTETAAFSKSVETKAVNIPSSAKIKNAKIKITKATSANTVTINSAVLT